MVPLKCEDSYIIANMRTNKAQKSIKPDLGSCENNMDIHVCLFQIRCEELAIIKDEGVVLCNSALVLGLQVIRKMIVRWSASDPK